MKRLICLFFIFFAMGNINAMNFSISNVWINKEDLSFDIIVDDINNQENLMLTNLRFDYCEILDNTLIVRGVIEDWKDDEDPFVPYKIISDYEIITNSKVIKNKFNISDKLLDSNYGLLNCIKNFGKRNTVKKSLTKINKVIFEIGCIYCCDIRLFPEDKNKIKEHPFEKFIYVLDNQNIFRFSIDLVNGKCNKIINADNLEFKIAINKDSVNEYLLIDSINK